MSGSHSVRLLLAKSLVVVGVLGSVLIGIAGTSLAAQADAADPASSTVSAGPAAGVSMGTFAWALAGLLLLVVGFIAASRSGRQAATAGPAVRGPAIRPFQPSQDAQGDSTSAAVII